MAQPYKTDIAEPASSRNLTTLAAVKIELGQTGTDQDAWLTQQIEQASAIIAKYCRREFVVETLIDHFRIHDVRCDDALSLSKVPVSSITEIAVGQETLTDDQFEFNSKEGFVWRLMGTTRSSWSCGTSSVTFVAGLTENMRKDLERACIMLVGQNWYSRGRDPKVKSEDIPGIARFDYWVGSVGENGAIPPDVQGIIRPYRLSVLR